MHVVTPNVPWAVCVPDGTGKGGDAHVWRSGHRRCVCLRRASRSLCGCVPLWMRGARMGQRRMCRVLCCGGSNVAHWFADPQGCCGAGVGLRAGEGGEQGRRLCVHAGVILAVQWPVCVARGTQAGGRDVAVQRRCRIVKRTRGGVPQGQGGGVVGVRMSAAVAGVGRFWLRECDVMATFFLLGGARLSEAAANELRRLIARRASMAA